MNMKHNEYIYKCIKTYIDKSSRFMNWSRSTQSVNLHLIKIYSEYPIVSWKQCNTDAQFYKIGIWKLIFWGVCFYDLPVLNMKYLIEVIRFHESRAWNIQAEFKKHKMINLK